MLKQSCFAILIASGFMSTSLLAQDKEKNVTQQQRDNPSSVTSDREAESENITDSVQRRGRVTQGVIGAEAEENKKLVPEESAAEKKEQESPSNIRLPEEIEDDLDSTSPPVAD
ncbi:MAG: hypothetical protein M1270_05390 [Gammaproteobacteria bacterium]|nr:hypothetical protein [Gammaproteobacteria bacterium]